MTFCFKHKLVSAAVLVVGATAAVHAGATAPPTYSMTQITNGGYLFANTAIVNNHGQVAWSYSQTSDEGMSRSHSALFTPGAGIAQLGPEQFRVSDINDYGVAVGGLDNFHSDYSPAMVDSRSGNFTQLSTDGGEVYSINNQGQMVGARKVMTSQWNYKFQAALYRSDGGIVDLGGDLTYGSSVYITDINEKGQVLLTDYDKVAMGTITGGFEALAVPPGTSSLTMYSNLTDNGFFTGMLHHQGPDGNSRSDAFIYRNGQYELLPGFADEQNYSKGIAVTASGVVVGEAGDMGGFYYSPGTGTVPLSSLLPSGCSISTVESMSESGYIAATGTCDGDHYELYLLSPFTAPVPEPTQGALLGLGLAALWFTRRRLL